MQRGQPFPIYALTFACIAAATARCGGSTTITTVASPTGIRCQTTVSAPQTAVSPDGGTVSVSIAAPRDCMWTASSEASWIQLSATSGQGDGSLTGTVARNELPAPRSAAVVINDQPVTVSQEPRPCAYELGSSRAQVGSQGGRGSVEVRTLSGCAWNASSSAAWLRVLTTSGSGSGTAEFDVASNEAGARDATMTIADRQFVVEQQSAERATPVCSFTLRPATNTISGRGGDGRFRVDTADGCQWSASTGASWITVSGGPRTGAGEVAYSVVTNPTASPRSAAISAGGQTHSVAQEAGPRPCTFVLVPSVQNVSAAGGNFSFQVNAEAACLWSATAGDSWITLRPGGLYGTGSAEVAYVVHPNTSKSARSTTINVGGQSHTVTQAGAP
jgi:hypothetical protein